MDETIVNNAVSCEQPVVEEPCKQQDKEEELALCETESSSSESSEVSSQDTPSSQRKSVKFQNVEIKEYGMVSGSTDLHAYLFNRRLSPCSSCPLPCTTCRFWEITRPHRLAPQLRLNGIRFDHTSSL